MTKKERELKRTIQKKLSQAHVEATEEKILKRRNLEDKLTNKMKAQMKKNEGSHKFRNIKEMIKNKAWTRIKKLKGELKNGLYHGQGLYHSAKSGGYKGEWKEGKAHGYGVSYDLQGNKHEGHYVNDLKNGHGS